MFSKESSQLCQSRFFKEWHPDYIASYNSLNDRHLKHYFQHPARKTHLNRNHKVSPTGDVVSEREWRKQNLEWERRRREAESQSERIHQREVDERRARMELRQQQKDEDSRRRRREVEVEEGGMMLHQRSPKAQVKEAWLDQNALLTKISDSNRQDVEHLLNFLNFEIEYILRPRSAPHSKYRSYLAPTLRTARRAQSASRSCANHLPGGGTRHHNHHLRQHPSPARITEEGRTKSLERFNHLPEDDRARSAIRNIEIPERDFSPLRKEVPPPQQQLFHQQRRQPLPFSRRPATAPIPRYRAKRQQQQQQQREQQRPRSPTRPHYKEEEYLLTQVVLRYVGHSDPSARAESRALYRAHRRRRRLPALPDHIDEVTIVQQPRGSYVLEVYHGFLAVGDEFHFTSRRVDSYPFSLTIYVNRQCHVRLSTCCESKRTVGSRLGQGCFQLQQLEGAVPCIRCLLERDPIAQKHAAKINKLRGTYDRYGNRKPPAVFPEEQKKTKRWKKRLSSIDQDLLESDEEDNIETEAFKRERRRGRRPQQPSSAPQQQSDRSPRRRRRQPRPKSAPKFSKAKSDSPGGAATSTAVTTAAAAEDEDYSSVDEESSEADIPLPANGDDDEEEEESTSSVDSSREDSSEFEGEEEEEKEATVGVSRDDGSSSKKGVEKKSESHSPAATRTLLVVEVKQQLETNYKLGMDVSEDLIQADKELHAEMEVLSSDKDDTVDEAPSIAADEDSSSSSSKTATEEESSSSSSEEDENSSSKWNSADNVRVLVGADRRLKRAASEGKEVSNVLCSSLDEEEKQQQPTQPEKRKRMSHFQAMALMGKLFFGFQKVGPITEEAMTNEVTESSLSECSSDQEQTTAEEEVIAVKMEDISNVDTKAETDNSATETSKMTTVLIQNESPDLADENNVIEVSQAQHKVEEHGRIGLSPEGPISDEGIATAILAPQKKLTWAEQEEEPLLEHEQLVEEKAQLVTDTVEDQEAKDDDVISSIGGTNEDAPHGIVEDASQAPAAASQDDSKEIESEQHTIHVEEAKDEKDVSSCSSSTSSAVSTESGTSKLDNRSPIQINIEREDTLDFASEKSDEEQDKSNTLQVPKGEGDYDTTDCEAKQSEEESQTESEEEEEEEEEEVQAVPVASTQPSFRSITHFQALVLLQRVFSQKRQELSRTKNTGTQEDNPAGSEESLSSHKSPSGSGELESGHSASFSSSTLSEDATEESGIQFEASVSRNEEATITVRAVIEQQTNMEMGNGGEVAPGNAEISTIQARLHDGKEEENMLASSVLPSLLFTTETPELSTELTIKSECLNTEALHNKFTGENSQAEPDHDSYEKQSTAETIRANDEENNAAIKIQAGYRGMKARTEINGLKGKVVEEQSDDASSSESEESESKTSKEQTEAATGFVPSELDEAAIKLQAGFRGMKARSEVKALKDKAKEKIEEASSSESDEASSDEQSETEETKPDVNDYTEEELATAATKIQAGYRGMKARSEVQALRDIAKETHDSSSSSESEDSDSETSEEQTKVNDGISLNTKELDEAAIKIQAGFRGMKARNEVKASMKKTEEKTASETEEEESDETLSDEHSKSDANSKVVDDSTDELANAATKIQAGFRGMKARNEVKAMKSKTEENASSSESESESESETSGSLAENKSATDLNNDLNELDGAAIKIQAGYRGMKARSEVNALKQKLDENEKEVSGCEQIVIAEIEHEDINDSSDELTTAATKIQAGYRGMRARIEVKALKKKTVEAHGDESSSESGSEESESEELSEAAADELNEAAIKIQAGYRGMKARSEVKELKNKADGKSAFDESSSESDSDDSESEESKKPSEIVAATDPNKSSDELDEAAIKIQASFRGMKARNEVKALKDNAEAGDNELTETAETHTSQGQSSKTELELKNADELTTAATKIQAGYRGMKARTEVKALKSKAEEKSTCSSLSDSESEESESDTSEEASETEAANNENGKAAIQVQADGLTINEAGGVKALLESKIEEVPDESSESENEESTSEEATESEGLDEAAIKIQAGYRGMKVRKEIKALKVDIQTKSEEISASKSVESNFGTPEANNEGSSEANTVTNEDLADLDKAATKIQAGYRGMKARSEVKALKDKPEDIISSSSSETDESDSEEPETETSPSDLIKNLNELDEAAIKIQAGFRGMKARNEVKALKSRGKDIKQTSSTESEDSENETAAETDIVPNENSEDLNKAATKIQAGYRGMKARTEVQAMRDTIECKQPTLEAEKAASNTSELPHNFTAVEVAKNENESSDSEESESSSSESDSESHTEATLDENADELAAAAAKIQAGYRGMKARTEVQEMKDTINCKPHLLEVEEPASNTSELPYKTEVDRNSDVASVEVNKNVKETLNANDSSDTEESESSSSESDSEAQTEVKATLEEEEDEELAAAATKIQAGFRGMKARTEVQAMKDTTECMLSPALEVGESVSNASYKNEVDPISDETIEENTIVSENVDEKESSDAEGSSSIESDSESQTATADELALAATKIQAGYREMKARAEVKVMKDTVENQTEFGGQSKTDLNVTEEKMDETEDSKPIEETDAMDDELALAATKIQAGFRGMQARNEVKTMKGEMDKAEEKQEITSCCANDDDDDTEELDKAATKIQAGYRGMKVRNDMKERDLKKNEQKSTDLQGTLSVIDELPVPLQEESVSKSNNITSSEMNFEATMSESNAVKESYPDGSGSNSKQQPSTISPNVEQPNESSCPMDDNENYEHDASSETVNSLKEATDMSYAATLIQAGLRGMQARKEARNKMSQKMAEVHDQRQSVADSGSSSAKVVVNYDSANDFTEDSDKDSESSSSSSDDEEDSSMAKDLSVGTNVSSLARNVLLQDLANSNADYDSGTSMSNQNTPRSSVSLPPLDPPIPVDSGLILMVQPAAATAEEVKVPNEQQEMEKLDESNFAPAAATSDSGTCEDEDDDDESSSSSNSADSGTSSAATDAEKQPGRRRRKSSGRTKKSPFMLLKRLVGIMQLPSKIRSRNKVCVGDLAPADVTKRKPSFLPASDSSTCQNSGRSTPRSESSRGSSSIDEDSSAKSDCTGKS